MPEILSREEIDSLLSGLTSKSIEKDEVANKKIESPIDAVDVEVEKILEEQKQSEKNEPPIIVDIPPINSAVISKPIPIIESSIVAEQAIDFNKVDYKNLLPQERAEFNKKLFAHTQGLWEYFVKNKVWQVENGAIKINDKKTYDLDAKISLLFLQQAGLEKEFVEFIVKNYKSGDTASADVFSKKTTPGIKTSSAKEFGLVLTKLKAGDMRVDNKALEVLAQLSVDYLYNDIIVSSQQLKDSPNTLRGLARFLDTKQLLYYVYAVAGKITNHGAKEVPFKKLYQQVLDSNVFDFKQTDKAAKSFGEIARKIKNSFGIRFDINKEQQKIINNAQKLFSSKNLAEQGKEFYSDEFGKVFINVEGLPNSIASSEFGGTSGTRAYGYDSFLNINVQKGGFLFTTVKPVKNLGERLGSDEVHWGMVIKPAQNRKFMPDEVRKLLVVIVPLYKPQGVFKKYLQRESETEKKSVEIKSSVSIPLFISKNRRQELADLGYTSDEIDVMKPVDAEKLVKNQITKKRPAEIFATLPDVSVDKVRSLVNKHVEIQRPLIVDFVKNKYSDKSAEDQNTETERMLFNIREQLYNEYKV